jgi:thiol-disulfide isomerase/thioredoxin
MSIRLRLMHVLMASSLLLFWTVVPQTLGQSSVHAVLQPPSERKVAPELALLDSSGNPVTLKDYRGKIVVLDFWATWCHGCKEEIPWFSDFERKYGGKDFSVVGISLDEEGWKVVKPFLKEVGVPYRIALGNDSTAKDYSIQNMPDTFLIDRDGRVAAKYVGVVDKADIENNIRSILAQR